MKTKLTHILFFLAMFAATAFSQEMRIVSGVIKDNGEPLPGVNIMQKGTSYGTVTDIDGYYEIQVPLGSTIQVSFVGMQTSEMVVTEANSKPGKTRPASVSPPQPAPVVPQKEIEEIVAFEEEIEDMNDDRVFTPAVFGDEDKTYSPYFLVKSNKPAKARMPLMATDVEVNIAGVIADVRVRQTYINHSNNTLEAVYVFPGSTRAAVYGMSMTVADRRIEAQIKKKEQARQEYEQAKEEGKSATLLEQHRPNVFQMNVANIQPGDTIVVEMNYTELLEHHNGTYEFAYPTVVGPRYSETGETWVEQTNKNPNERPNPAFNIVTNLQAGMPIRKVSSTSHSLSIESITPDRATIALSNTKDYEGDRDYIIHYDLQGGKVESGLLLYEHGDENFFLLMMQPPKKPELAQIPPREYVFIVDVSGSMNGFPLNISKELIRNIASSLRPVDRFNVMLFESSNAMLYKESLPATSKNIEQALTVIDRQEGRGGTRLYPAIENAMKFPGTEGFSRSFIVITDGFVSVEKELFNYVRSHLNEANLFAFGIGSSVNRYVIEGLAHAGMGTPYIVTNRTEAEAIGKKVIADISQPVLTNIDIDWGTFDVYDVEPVAIPDVFAVRPILVYGKYKEKAKGVITVSGMTGDMPYAQKFDVSKAGTGNNRALRYLWARNQIRYYDDYAQYYEGNTNGWSDSYKNHDRSSKQIERVTNLGLQYNLLTQYTSFLAVDHVIRKPAPAYNEPEPAPYIPKTSPNPSVPQSVSSPDINLTETATSLDEVVVVGYGSIRRTEYTSSSYSMATQEISGSMSQVLHGRVAGLSATSTSGEPGESSRIRIRGNSSITGQSSPLVIVDGVPVEDADIQNMDMSNIDNISVLKDASAAAVYGSRAASGVLLITTKTPKYKKLNVSLSSSVSIEQPRQLPDMQQQYTQGRPENGAPVWNSGNEPFSWGPAASQVNAPTHDAYDFLGTGHTFRNYLTVSGKNGQNDYMLKLGNNTQKGFIPESGFQENSIALRLGSIFSDKFNYNLNLSYTNTNADRLQRGYNMSGIMQGILLTPASFDNNAGTTLPEGSQRSAGTAADNPYWALDNNEFGDKTDRVTGRLNLKYQMSGTLSFNYLLGGEYLSGEKHTALNRTSTYYAPGHVMNRDEDFRSVSSNLTANYRKTLGDFQVEALAGYEYTNSGRTIDRTDGYKLRTAGDYNVQHTDSIVPFAQSFYRYSNALYGKMSIDFRSQVILEAGMRGEWSSISSDVLLAPSVGLAANFHNIFDIQDVLSYFKLYGNISSVDRETPLYIDPVYFNSAIYSLNDASSHFESREITIGNLKPETIVNYELGVSLGFLDQRISLSTALYRKTGKDQLLPVQVNTTSVQLENGGTFRTNGFEVQLDAFILSHSKYSWNMGFNFSRERSIAKNLGGRKLMLAGIEGVAGSYAIEGQPLGVIYGTAYQRDTQGRVIIGSDGFPVVSNELSVLGDPNPDWRMGWTNTFTYGRLSLSVLIDYKKGGVMWNGTRNAMNYYGTSQYSADHRNTTGYVFEGVHANGQINQIPVDFTGSELSDNRWVRYGQYGVAEDAIEDASYLKLRDISLSYRFPIRMMNRQTHLKVAVSAYNIMLHKKYSGVDPETNLTGASNGLGLDYFNIPGIHSFGMSLNWEF